MQERKDLTTTLNDETGVKEIHLTHTRVIGEKSFPSKQSITAQWLTTVTGWVKLITLYHMKAYTGFKPSLEVPRDVFGSW